MNEFTETVTEPIAQLKSEAQRALQERPILSVRSLISLGFALWFILSVGITVASIIIVNKIEEKLYFMESASKYIFEVQQARRFEKNYFLYRTNLDDSLKQVRLADDILENNSEKMSAVVGRQSFDGMVHHINLYEELLSKLQRLDRQQSLNASPDDVNRIEDELREHGAEMVAAAQNLLARERQSVNHMIYLSKRVPMLFLLFLLVLMIICANFMARQIVRPLKVLMDATRRRLCRFVDTVMNSPSYRWL